MTIAETVVAPVATTSDAALWASEVAGWAIDGPDRAVAVPYLRAQLAAAMDLDLHASALPDEEGERLRDRAGRLVTDARYEVWTRMDVTVDPVLLDSLRQVTAALRSF